MEIFIYFLINSDPNLTQTQIPTLKPTPNQTLPKPSQTLICILKVNENYADN